MHANSSSGVTDQRRQLKATQDGRPSQMTDDRKQKLDALGFIWKVRERADWNDRYEQLLEYKKENGHCVVPQVSPSFRRCCLEVLLDVIELATLIS